MHAAVKGFMGSDAFTAMSEETQDIVVESARAIFLQHLHARALRGSPTKPDANEIEAAGARAGACLSRVKASMHEILTSTGAEVPLHLASMEARKEARDAGTSSKSSERANRLQAEHLASLSQYEIDRLATIAANHNKLSELGL